MGFTIFVTTPELTQYTKEEKMNDKIERRRRFLINTAFFAVIAAIAYVLLKYALPVIMPFFIAFIISAILQPVIDFLRKRVKLGQKGAASIVVVLFLCTIGVLLVCIIIKLVISLTDIIAAAPAYYTNTIQPALRNLIDYAQNLLRKFDSDITLDYNEIIPSLSDLIPSIKSIFSFTTNILTSVPGFFITVLITIISIFFISADYHMLCHWVIFQLPENVGHTVLEIKKYIKDILLKYVRSYALIMSITFLELSILLLIAGLIKSDMFASVGSTLLTAFFIAMFDLLPIVGVGSVLMPWAIIRVLLGDLLTGAMLAAIFLIIVVVRNIIEPKIVGTQVGLHPIVTLMAMITGTALFGVVGLFVFPITLALLKDLNDRGKIHIFKKVPENKDK